MKVFHKSGRYPIDSYEAMNTRMLHLFKEETAENIQTQRCVCIHEGMDSQLGLADRASLTYHALIFTYAQVNLGPSSQNHFH